MEIFDKYYTFLRSNDDINISTQLYLDDLIYKYYNIVNIKLENHHICLLKEYFDDDLKFENYFQNFKEFTKPTMIHKKSESCINCNLECYKNINSVFDFHSAVFVTDILNRGSIYNKKIKKQLSNLFFNHFYIENNEIIYDEERMLKLFIDFDLQTLESRLLELNTRENLELLIKLKDEFTSLLTRTKSLNEEVAPYLNISLEFVSKKLIYFKELNDFEKENPAQLYDKIPFKFENKFDVVDEIIIYNYFNKNLVEKGYLPKEDLEKFLLLAFQNKKLPKEKFKLSDSRIGFFTNIFYQYYYDIASKPHGKKKVYAELLGLYFKGFETEKVMNNFARYS